MIEPIIHRLMRELEDGSFEVAGYGYHKEGRIYHFVDLIGSDDTKAISSGLFFPVYQPEEEWFDFCDTPDVIYIQHHRIDRFTGVTLNDEAKTKVFERDIIECEIDDSDLLGRGQSGFKKHTETIRSRPMFDTEYVTGGPDGWTKLINIKIVGIEGVHKTEETL